MPASEPSDPPTRPHKGLRLRPFLAAPRTTRGCTRRWGSWLRWLWRRIVRIEDTPHRVGWGFAIGMVIGWLPIVGIQMAVAAGAAWLLRGNILASIPPVWLSNPLTLVPMYWIENQLGALFCGEAISWQRMAGIWAEVGRLGAWDGAGYLLAVAWQALLAMMLGGLLLGVAWAIPSYFLIRRAVVAAQARVAARRRAWAGRLPA